MKGLLAKILVLALLPQLAQAQQVAGDRAAFRAIYKEMVETNTTFSVGSCTLLSERIAARLKAAGFSDGDLTTLFGSTLIIGGRHRTFPFDARFGCGLSAAPDSVAISLLLRDKRGGMHRMRLDARVG